MKPDYQPENKPKRGRPKTGRTVTMAEYQRRHRANAATQGIIDFTVRLPISTIEAIKTMAAESGKTRAQVVTDLVAQAVIAQA